MGTTTLAISERTGCAQVLVPGGWGGGEAGNLVDAAALTGPLCCTAAWLSSSSPDFSSMVNIALSKSKCIWGGELEEESSCSGSFQAAETRAGFWPKGGAFLLTGMLGSGRLPRLPSPPARPLWSPALQEGASRTAAVVRLASPSSEKEARPAGP